MPFGTWLFGIQLHLCRLMQMHMKSLVETNGCKQEQCLQQMQHDIQLRCGLKLLASPVAKMDLISVGIHSLFTFHIELHVHQNKLVDRDTRVVDLLPKFKQRLPKGFDLGSLAFQLHPLLVHEIFVGIEGRKS